MQNFIDIVDNLLSRHSLQVRCMGLVLLQVMVFHSIRERTTDINKNIYIYLLVFISSLETTTTHTHTHTRTPFSLETTSSFVFRALFLSLPHHFLQTMCAEESIRLECYKKGIYYADHYRHVNLRCIHVLFYAIDVMLFHSNYTMCCLLLFLHAV